MVQSYGATGSGLSAPGQNIMSALGNEMDVTRELAVIELMGFEGKNNYVIRSAGKDQLIAHTREESGCFDRTCCGSGREATFVVHETESETYGKASGPVALKFKKPRHYLCCTICSRPRLQVLDAAGHALGSVEDPFSCCSLNQTLKDSSGNLQYSVSGPCYQLGVMCPCLADATLDISSSEGKVVGTMKRLQLSCMEMFAPVTRMHVAFPTEASPEDKALLLASQHLMDLVYFGVEGAAA